MKPRTALAFLAVAVLLLSVEARRKSSSSKSSKSSSGRGSASKQAPLRTAKNRQQQVQSNAAVKKAVAAMRSGRIKPNGGRSGSAPSPSNLNQPQSASNLNRPQSYPGQQQQQRPLSPTNTQNPQAPQSAGGAQNYNQPPPSYQQAVGGQQPMMQPVAYPQGGYPQGGYPGAPPMGYPMMPPPMQQAAPEAKKGLIPDWLKPRLVVDVVPLAMMAARPIKSLFTSRREKKENEMRRRINAENGTDVDLNNTMAGPPFMFAPPNGSLPEFPMGPPPPFPPPGEGENMTAEDMQPPPPYPYIPQPQQFVDENGTVLHFAPRPFYPYGMYPPQMQQQGENGAAPMMYPQYQFPPPYPYAYAPQANPFIQQKMPHPEGEPQVPGVVQSGEPERMGNPPQVMVDPPMPESLVTGMVVSKTEGEAKDDAPKPEGDVEVKPTLEANKDIVDAVKPAVAAAPAAA